MCFAQTEIKYLDYCVNKYSIRLSIRDENIDSVLNYPVPRDAKKVHRFVGFASYFRQFIRILDIGRTNLIKKNTTFKFGPLENTAFEKLKNHLARPMLANQDCYAFMKFLDFFRFSRQVL